MEHERPAERVGGGRRRVRRGHAARLQLHVARAFRRREREAARKIPAREVEVGPCAEQRRGAAACEGGRERTVFQRRQRLGAPVGRVGHGRRLAAARPDGGGRGGRTRTHHEDAVPRDAHAVRRRVRAVRQRVARVGGGRGEDLHAVAQRERRAARQRHRPRTESHSAAGVHGERAVRRHVQRPQLDERRAVRKTHRPIRHGQRPFGTGHGRGEHERIVRAARRPGDARLSSQASRERRYLPSGRPGEDELVGRAGIDAVRARPRGVSLVEVHVLESLVGNEVDSRGNSGKHHIVVSEVHVVAAHLERAGLDHRAVPRVAVVAALVADRQRAGSLLEESSAATVALRGVYRPALADVDRQIVAGRCDEAQPVGNGLGRLQTDTGRADAKRGAGAAKAIAITCRTQDERIQLGVLNTPHVRVVRHHHRVARHGNARVAGIVQPVVGVVPVVLAVARQCRGTPVARGGMDGNCRHGRNRRHQHQFLHARLPFIPIKAPLSTCQTRSLALAREKS